MAILSFLCVLVLFGVMPLSPLDNIKEVLISHVAEFSGLCLNLRSCSYSRLFLDLHLLFSGLRLLVSMVHSGYHALQLFEQYNRMIRAKFNALTNFFLSTSLRCLGTVTPRNRTGTSYGRAQ